MNITERIPEEVLAKEAPPEILEELITDDFLERQVRLTKRELTPRESDLSSPRVESRDKFLGGNIGGARLVHIEGDGDGVFKPHDTHSTKKRMEFIGRERSAYLVSEFLGFGIVPPTIVRSIDEDIGSFQEFIQGAKTGYESALLGSNKENQMLLMTILDMLIDNTDRHGMNFLIKDGTVVAIDHGHSFWLDRDHFNSSRVFIGTEDLSSVIVNGSPICESLANFARSKQMQNALRSLIREQLGIKVAHLYIDRILLFIACVNSENKFDQQAFSDGLEKLTAKYGLLEE